MLNVKISGNISFVPMTWPNYLHQTNSLIGIVIYYSFIYKSIRIRIKKNYKWNNNYFIKIFKEIQGKNLVFSIYLLLILYHIFK